jgi:hypothetical protein
MSTDADRLDGLFPTGTTEPVVPTEAEIDAAKTPAGGWTRAQLSSWGVPWPPPKGWRRDLIAKSRAHHGTS